MMSFIDCVPPWYTEDETKVCREIPEDKKQKTAKAMRKLWSGIECVKPCETIQIETSLYYSGPSFLDYTWLQLEVNPMVERFKRIRKVTLFTVINNIGSSMGLWLGVSIFIIYEIINNTYKHFKNSGLSRSGIYNILARFDENGNVDRKSGSGRPKILSKLERLTKMD